VWLSACRVSEFVVCVTHWCNKNRMSRASADAIEMRTPRDDALSATPPPPTRDDHGTGVPGTYGTLHGGSGDRADCGGGAPSDVCGEVAATDEQRGEAGSDAGGGRLHRASSVATSILSHPYHVEGSTMEDPTLPPPSAPRTILCIKTTRYGVGIALILLVAIIWVAASEWIQRIFGSMHYDKPFFLTYLNTGGFMLWNFGYFASSWRAVPRGWGNAHAEEHRPLSSGDDASSRFNGHPDDHGEALSLPAVPTPQPPYSLKRIFWCAFYFCPLWFFANVLFNYSLSRTSVASNTVLSSTSSVWTLLLSRVILKQRIDAMKLCAIALSIGGSALIGLSDSSGKDTLAGDILALASAFFYAAYTTVLRWCLPNEELYYMGMVFGFVGVINTVLMWPGFLILNWAHVETFELPDLVVFGALALNSLIGTNLSDVLWAKSVILTSPVVATLGLSLTTPLAMIADAVLHHKHFGLQYISGAVLVTVGFVVANVT
jgi:solute carrier family 35, member F5